MVASRTLSFLFSNPGVPLPSIVSAISVPGFSLKLSQNNKLSHQLMSIKMLSYHQEVSGVKILLLSSCIFLAVAFSLVSNQRIQEKKVEK